MPDKIEIPLELMHKITDLLGDNAEMKPSFEIYESAKQLTLDLTTCISGLIK